MLDTVIKYFNNMKECLLCLHLTINILVQFSMNEYEETLPLQYLNVCEKLTYRAFNLILGFSCLLNSNKQSTRVYVNMNSDSHE